MPETFITITPGAGGPETHDCANLLTRMYLRWAERKGYAVEIPAGAANSLKFTTPDTACEAKLRSEVGIHRFTRISPLDPQRRRHTSFIAVTRGISSSPPNYSHLEQVRGYYFHPYQSVVDYRTGCRDDNVHAFLDGDLDRPLHPKEVVPEGEEI